MKCRNFSLIERLEAVQVIVSRPCTAEDAKWAYDELDEIIPLIASHFSQQSASRAATLAPDTQIKCAGKAIWCSAQNGENCTLEYGRCPGQRI